MIWSFVTIFVVRFLDRKMLYLVHSLLLFDLTV